MDKSDAIKKLNQMGFKAKDDQNMVYVDLTKVSDEEIVDTVFRLQDALKEMEYNKSYGFKYNSSALEIVTEALKKARGAQPVKEPKEEDTPKRTRTRIKKTDAEKITPKKETANKSKMEAEEKIEEKPKRTRRSSQTTKQEVVSDEATKKEKENASTKKKSARKTKGE